MADPEPEPRQFSDQLCELFANVVLEWTRKHHPERLLPDDEYAEWLRQHARDAAEVP